MDETGRSTVREYNVSRYEMDMSIEELLGDYWDYEFTLSKCRDCSGFGKTWSCPEFDFDPSDFFRRYSSFHLVVDKVDNAGTASMEEAVDRLLLEKRSFDKDMRDMEADIPGSYGLAAQECIECNKCARLSGKPCIHPEIMRYGLEALGVFPVKLAKDKFDLETIWSDGTSIPEYYLLIAGILVP